MQRILVLGGPGAGKTHLARKIGARLGVEVVHLDTLNFEPGWLQIESEVFRARIAEAISGDRWVTDGNYLDKTADLRLRRADSIIWLEQPRWLRMYRSIRRILLTPELGRPDLPNGCREHLDWEFVKYAWNFEQHERDSIFSRVREMAPTVPLTFLSGDDEVTAFLSSLEV